MFKLTKQNNVYHLTQLKLDVPEHRTLPNAWHLWCANSTQTSKLMLAEQFEAISLTCLF
jgi:hypothetical protein